ncbi:uncharacterized protein LOC134275718 [Saccostrea cucullata]|uniref:uncharacterized protein LOC134275718 n=1 Tax=Saccostrea cuccullata TaxID=36930 RepID=UPI002ED1BF5E
MASTQNKRPKFNSDNTSQERSRPDSENRESTETAASRISPGIMPGHSSPSSLQRSYSGQSSLTDHGAFTTGSPNLLPENLSDWRRRNVEYLNIRIVFEPETTPFDLLTEKCWSGRRKGMGFPVNFSVFEAEEKHYRDAEEDLKIKKLVDLVKSSGFLKVIEELNYSSFEEFNLTTLKRLKTFTKQSYIPKYLPGEFDAWFRRFDVEVKNFFNILSRLVENVIKEESNHKYLFQHLFDAFVKIFGMHSGVSFEPILDVQTLGIGESEVKGSPDIVFHHHRIREGEGIRLDKYVVAVCEVEKDKPLPAENISPPPSNKTGNNSDSPEVPSSSTQDRDLHHDVLQLSDNLIGKHCGELLLKFGESIHCNSVFGIVVQQTYVTIAELGMTDIQYLKLKEGRFKHSKRERPSFTFTKPYNFLKKEGLERLLEPLIKFGLEQEE